MTLRLRIGRLIAAIAVSVLFSGCGTDDRPGGMHPPPASDGIPSARVDQAVTDAMRSARIPGALIGLWSPRGEYVQAFGVADTGTGVPMETDFHSRIGSVTKTFTATAVLQLVDAGKVGLDDPIARYLDGVPNGEGITVRQLADMRSGLVDYTKTDEFIAAMTADPEQSFTPQQLLGWAFAQPAAFAPGQRVQYSNTNYILLGLLVEKVGGQSFGDYLSEHILDPLGMSDTGLPPGGGFPNRTPGATPIRWTAAVHPWMPPDGRPASPGRPAPWSRLWTTCASGYPISRPEH